MTSTLQFGLDCDEFGEKQAKNHLHGEADATNKK